jgi:hypothetical protein
MLEVKQGRYNAEPIRSSNTLKPDVRMNLHLHADSGIYRSGVNAVDAQSYF